MDSLYFSTFLLLSSICFLPLLVVGSSLSAPSVVDAASKLIHEKTVHVPMGSTKYWKFNHRQHHINGMRLNVIDGPIAGCPQQDFHVPCTVGGQNFNCQVDTGSTTLGIATTACAACGGVTTFYDPKRSGAVQLSTGDMSSVFGDKSGWIGNAYQDMTAVSGSTATSMVLVGITNQTRFFPGNNICNQQVSPLQFSAIMGFAGRGIAIHNQVGVTSDPWFANYAAATGAPALFTLRMCLNTGDLWLGGYNNSTYTDQLHWVNIQQLGPFAPGQGYYTVAVECIGIQGGAADCNGDDFQNGVNTIVDSGTTLAIIPNAAYNNIINQLNNVPQFAQLLGSSASAFYKLGNCVAPPGNVSIAAMNAVMPKIIIQIGGADSGVPLVMTLNGVNFYLTQVFTQNTIFYCPGIASNLATIGTNTVILGWSFMNQVIVAHDLSRNKIGFAPRLGCNDVSIGGGAINTFVGGDVNVTDATGSLGISAFGANPGNQGTPPPSSSNNMKTIGIVVGVIVGVLVLAGILIAFYIYRQKNKENVAVNTMQQQYRPPAGGTWA